MRVAEDKTVHFASSATEPGVRDDVLFETQIDGAPPRLGSGQLVEPRDRVNRTDRTSVDSLSDLVIHGTTVHDALVESHSSKEILTGLGHGLGVLGIDFVEGAARVDA